MIADEIARAISKYKWENTGRNPEAVYIEPKTLRDMLSQIQGRVSSAAMEAVERSTIRGVPLYEVYLVSTGMGQHEGKVKQHAPWRVV